MIGHIYTRQGAIGLASAPSATDWREVVVLARLDDTYVVGRVPADRFPNGDDWVGAEQFHDALSAADGFVRAAGLVGHPSGESRAAMLLKHIRAAEEQIGLAPLGAVLKVFPRRNATA